MRLSSMADYAVLTMSAAARHCGGARLNAAQLADETGLPGPTVAKLVSRLSGAGLLKSVRGAHGGFKLARPAAAITIADIVEAVDGPIALTACVDGGMGGCESEHLCPVRGRWDPVNHAIREALAGISVADLAGGNCGANLSFTTDHFVAAE